VAGDRVFSVAAESHVWATLAGEASVLRTSTRQTQTGTTGDLLSICFETKENRDAPCRHGRLQFHVSGWETLRSAQPVKTNLQPFVAALRARFLPHSHTALLLRVACSGIRKEPPRASTDTQNTSPACRDVRERARLLASSTLLSVAPETPRKGKYNLSFTVYGR
jgi:hypothetical protein